MKKNVFSIIIVFLFLFLVSISAGAESIDIVIMVDVSASMEPYFEKIIRAYVREVLEKSIEPGDFLSFLSFSSSADVEIFEEIENRKEIEIILKKIYTLQPIDLYTDLITAVEFLNSYTETLPKKRPKLIMLFTDGIHDPRPGSKNDIDSDSVLKELLSSAEEIRHEGWSIHIFELPSRFQNEQKSFIKELSEALGAETNPFEDDGKNIDKIKEDIPDIRKNNKHEIFSFLKEIDWKLVFFIIGGLLILLLLLFLLSRLVFSVFSRKTTVKATKKKKYPYKKGGFREQQIEMRVFMQNPNIGFRNIHNIKKGRKKAIGGRNSSFLIFLSPFPSHAAEIHFDGNLYTFVPVKMNFFPEIKGPIRGCLEKEIPAVSRKGYPVILFFSRYVSPLEKLNNFLRSGI